MTELVRYRPLHIAITHCCNYTKVKYECINGYRRVEGDRLRYCKDGKLLGKQPKCRFPKGKHWQLVKHTGGANKQIKLAMKIMGKNITFLSFRPVVIKVHTHKGFLITEESIVFPFQMLVQWNPDFSQWNKSEESAFWFEILGGLRNRGSEYWGFHVTTLLPKLWLRPYSNNIHICYLNWCIVQFLETMSQRTVLQWLYIL